MKHQAIEIDVSKGKENDVTAIIVDDEQHARQVTENMLHLYCPEVKVLTGCSNVPDAVLAIKEHKPDVVFLDIEMPDYNGFTLLKFFDEVFFQIVFVTAYSQYALQAFELAAVDYLLKPLQADKLKEAVERLRQKLSTKDLKQQLELLQENLNNGSMSKIALPISDGILFVNVDDILYLMADGAYTELNLTNDSKVIVSRKLKFFEDLLLKRKNFFRIHRSYLINLNFVNKYNRSESIIALDNNVALPVSKDRKKEFEESFAEIRIAAPKRHK
jgi:two-component system LytT family response regulator